MKQQAIDSLNREMMAKTGIDFKRYQNQELIVTLRELVAFPVYALQTMYRPPVVIASIMIGVSVFFFLVDRILLSSLFLPVSLLFAVIIGVLLGLILLIYRLTGDTENILNTVLEISQTVLNDLKTVHGKLADKTFALPKLSDIVSGVMYIVVLPGAHTIVRDSVPFFGRPAGYLMEKIFNAAMKGIRGVLDNDEKALEEQTAGTQTPDIDEKFLQRFCTLGVEKVESVKGIVAKIIDVATRASAAPFKFVLFVVTSICALILLALIYFLW